MLIFIKIKLSSNKFINKFSNNKLLCKKVGFIFLLQNKN